jgi:hypothetical protein
MQEIRLTVVPDHERPIPIALKEEIPAAVLSRASLHFASPPDLPSIATAAVARRIVSAVA